MTDSKTPEWIEAASGDLALDYVDWLGRDKVDPDAEHVLSVSISQAILSAYERGRAEREWQDISTAPKDGTKLDLWVVFQETGARRVPDAHWNDKLGGWQLGQHNALDYMTPPAITHWMPLPAAATAIRQLLEVKG